MLICIISCFKLCHDNDMIEKSSNQSHFTEYLYDIKYVNVILLNLPYFLQEIHTSIIQGLLFQ